MAAFYFAQLLRAVLHVHEAGFCHRDIKVQGGGGGQLLCASV